MNCERQHVVEFGSRSDEYFFQKTVREIGKASLKSVCNPNEEKGMRLTQVCGLCGWRQIGLKIDGFEKCFHANQRLVIHRRNCRRLLPRIRSLRGSERLNDIPPRQRLKHHHNVFNNLSIMFASSAAALDSAFR